MYALLYYCAEAQLLLYGVLPKPGIGDPIDPSRGA